MPTGADPPSRGGDACIYQIKTNPVSPLPAPAGGRAPAALVTLDNLGPIAAPSPGNMHFTVAFWKQRLNPQK